MRISSLVSRNLRETAAAFTNCGRLPTTVAIDTTSLGGVAVYIQTCAAAVRKGLGRSDPPRVVHHLPGRRRPALAQLFLDVAPQRLRRVARALARRRRQLEVLDRGDGLDLTRRRREERLVCVAYVVDCGRAFLDFAQVHDAVARDRGEDVLVERWRAQRALRVQPEDRRGRRFEHAPMWRDQERFVEAALLGLAARKHVARVRERLDAVEHARWGIGD